MASGSRLSGIDVADNDDVDVSLFFTVNQANIVSICRERNVLDTSGEHRTNFLEFARNLNQDADFAAATAAQGNKQKGRISTYPIVKKKKKRIEMWLEKDGRCDRKITQKNVDFVRYAGGQLAMEIRSEEESFGWGREFSQ